MIRRLDKNGDWVFGNGKGAYIGDLAGLCLRLETQLREWTGDCFFALARGIDWHLMDKREAIVTRQVRNSIMRNSEVKAITGMTIEKTAKREWKPRISIVTEYGEASL